MALARDGLQPIAYKKKTTSTYIMSLGYLCSKEEIRIALCMLADRNVARSCKIGHVYVVVNILSQVIFIFILFLGMIMYANEV